MGCSSRLGHAGSSLVCGTRCGECRSASSRAVRPQAKLVEFVTGIMSGSEHRQHLNDRAHSLARDSWMARACPSPRTGEGLWQAGFHAPGDTVSAACLNELVHAAEAHKWASEAVLPRATMCRLSGAPRGASPSPAGRATRWRPAAWPPLPASAINDDQARSWPLPPVFEKGAGRQERPSLGASSGGALSAIRQTGRRGQRAGRRPTRPSDAMGTAPGGLAWWPGEPAHRQRKWALSVLRHWRARGPRRRHRSGCFGHLGFRRHRDRSAFRCPDPRWPQLWPAAVRRLWQPWLAHLLGHRRQGQPGRECKLCNWVSSPLPSWAFCAASHLPPCSAGSRLSRFWLSSSASRCVRLSKTRRSSPCWASLTTPTGPGRCTQATWPRCRAIWR
jgi:hypothetical protein